MAKGDTKTNQYLDIAANGTRADLPTDTCCETRSQTLIREVAERIMDVEDEVEEIKNNPDVVDIVPTYAALQNYDTSGLTDKDIIRVLADETHDGASTYYRWSTTTETFTYIGEVGDYYTKTQVDTLLDGKQDELTAGDNITIEDESGALVISATDTTYSNFTGTDGTAAGTAGLVPAPIATDTDKYLKSDGTWATVSGGGTTYTAGDGIDITNAVISATNTGKARALTTDDYNWPTSDPDGVALWLLEPGFYTLVSPTKVYATSTVSYDNAAITALIAEEKNSNVPMVFKRNEGDWQCQTINKSTGVRNGNLQTILTTDAVIDNLTTTLTAAPLSANQGKVLKDLVDSIAIKNAGAPTTATTGTVGQLLEDTTNGKLYICTDTTGGSYTWVEVGAGGSGGGVTELTTADYNWPTNNPDGVALWLLDSGKYVFPTAGIKIYACSNQTAEIISSAGDYTFVNIVKGDINSFIYYMNEGVVKQISVRLSDGVPAYRRQLNNPDIVQSTGTSTTDVMSQNAVTSMVFADPSTKQKVQVGGNSYAIGTLSAALGYGAETLATGIGSIAIGHGAKAGNGAIAIGRGTHNTTAGTVSFQDTNWGTSGYGGTGYRLLTGLYDPQSDHDAATKGYVDPTTDSSAPTTATVGRLGQIQIDTTTATAYMCVAADTATPSYTWKQITA